MFEMRSVVVAAMLMVLGMFNAAQAGTLYKVGTGSSVSAHDSGPGLVVQTALSGTLAGRTFALNDGESAAFAFFRIWTDEITIDPDDVVPQPITATLDFMIPDEDAALTGDTTGVAELSGYYVYGQLTWSGPVIVHAADRTFRVTLSDTKFNEGTEGTLGDGKRLGADVTATVHQCSSVPLPPAAYAGLGMLVSLGVARRSRIAA